MDLQDDHFAKLLLAYPEGTTLVNTDGTHYKFWNIQAGTESVTTTYGRIGKKPHSSVKQTYIPQREMRNQIRIKLQKGYEHIA